MRAASSGRARSNVGFDLTEYLEHERRQVSTALTRALSAFEPALPDALAGAAAHGVLSGGKALRPILCVSAYRAAGGGYGLPGEAIYALAVSLEFIHGYSLMHDDLPCMDDAALRRGLPTTHRVHGEAATVLAGAALIPMAALQALEGCRALGLADPRAREVVLELLAAAGAGGMVGGQTLDLLAEGELLSAEELGTLHGLKTGALLTSALRMGALAADAPGPILDAFSVFGRAIGLAFQIADDLLDATTGAETLGKNPSDLAMGKSTYVSLHGTEGARTLARAQVTRARAALDGAGMTCDEPAAAVLHALAEYTVSRAH
jgi:geranylgeranyl pyrophosphate synthase